MPPSSCRVCGAEVLATAKFCPQCGTRLSPAAAGSGAPAIVRPPLAPPAQDVPEPPLPDGYTLHADPWNGFRIGIPPGWRVATRNGFIRVYDVTQPLCAALLWPIRLAEPVPVAQVAQEFARLLREGNPTAQIWQQAGTDAAAGQIILRVRSVLKGQPLAGYYTALADGANALVSGFACPDALLATYGEVLQRVLGGFQPIPVLPKQPVQEPGEAACQVQIPQGWIFRGGINRVAGSPATFRFLAAREPQALTAAGVPAISWSYVVGHPNQGMFNIQGGPQTPPPMSAAQYCRQVLPQWLSQYQRDQRIEAVEDQPEITATLKAQAVAAGMGEPPSVSYAVLVSSYSEEGHRLLQKTRLAVHGPAQSAAFSRGRPQSWSASITNFTRAPVGEFELWEPILDGILASVVANPTWEQQEVQRFQNLMLQSNAASIAHLEQLGQINRPVRHGASSGSGRAGDSAGSTRQERLNEAFVNYIGDVETVTDGQGSTFTVPSGYQGHWFDARTNTVYLGDWRTDRPDSNWVPLGPTGI